MAGLATRDRVRRGLRRLPKANNFAVGPVDEGIVSCEPRVSKDNIATWCRCNDETALILNRDSVGCSEAEGALNVVSDRKGTTIS